MIRNAWLLVSAAAMVLACHTSDDDPAPQPKPSTLRVEARLALENVQNVHVYRDGVADDAAVVRVNGEVLPLFNADGFYVGELATNPGPGEGMLLEVLSGDLEVVGTGTVPEDPVGHLTMTAGGDASISWTTSSSPAWFELVAQWSSGGVERQVDGWARDVTIPARSLPQGEYIRYRVNAVNVGRLGGDVSDGGYLHLSSLSLDSNVEL